MTKVSDIMDKNPIVVSPTAPVRVVARKMNDQASDAVFICEKGRLRGVVSERSMISAMAGANDNLRKLHAGDIMSREGPKISAGVDVLDAAKHMARRKVRWLPVVQNGRFVGVITLDHLASESLTLASLVLDRMQGSPS